MRPRHPRRDRRRPGRSAFVLIERRRPPWRRWFPVLVALALLIAAPMFAYAQSPDSVALAWTGSGDDGNVGTPTTVELRYDTSPITLASWDAATLVPGMPVPGPAGTAQRVVVHGLAFGTTYYFSLRSSDEAGNWSGLSNLVAWSWSVDTSPPAAPAGLTVTRGGAGARLTWSANGEPDLAGYEVFRGGASAGPFALACDSLLPAPGFDDPALPGGGAAWYRVVAVDLSGNASAPSAAVALSLEKSDIVLQPAYPNPSPLAGPVRIPALVAAAHPGARLDILDAGGRRVRVIDLSGLAPGSADVVWDGRNDAGRSVAPGVYSAVLAGAGVAQVVRLVRVP
jgi:hypothetical protein